jgi:chloride channel protein, CIC family
LPVVEPDARDIAVGYLSRIKALAVYNKALIDEHIEHHI